MLEISRIRSDYNAVVTGLRKRNLSPETMQLVDEVLQQDDQRKMIQSELDQLLAQRNQLSKEIGSLMQQDKREEAETMKQSVADIKITAESLQEKLNSAKDRIEAILLQLPNVPQAIVPEGRSADDNEMYREWKGPLPAPGEKPEPHWELGKKYRLFDFELGVKITGSGFPLYRGKGAKLQRALIRLFLDKAIDAGYEEIIPPLLVNEDSARATGQLPDKEGQMYHCTVDNLYLIPTAEVPVTNIYRDVIVQESDFPIKLTGYTPCFRREAGSYGSDVKGLNRVHQFDKVEIVQFQHPDQSDKALLEMVEHVAGILDELGLPYRIVRLCGGDLGHTSSITYDFEVFSAAQQKWLEVSSVSNFETFQTNRMRLRFRNAEGQNQLAHSLNGSALALARVVAALLEYYQTSDGIEMPFVLIPYTGFERID
ncbi:MAG: serine--tRNA ligase [Saprospiraceae bacterium]|nr:serine--tRNA ligase [Saprospiraceae bacterium]MCB9321477.1 serine--tRNA ligase [Lewinellaceae bacterium]